MTEASKITPILSARQMAEFNMRPNHLKSYRQANLAHIEKVNGKAYADEVKSLMIEIHKKVKK